MTAIVGLAGAPLAALAVTDSRQVLLNQWL